MTIREAGAPRKLPSVTCAKCGKEVGASYYQRHLGHCDGIRKEM